MNETSHLPTPRLTSLAHGGGCGCKLAPSVLQDLLSGQSSQGAWGAFPQLLVGTETADDAAGWQVNDELAVVATTDFFTPVVDDPTDFGRIAATNAISDIYAMGGRPIMALAILGMPLGRLAPEVVRDILSGGASVCAAAGIPVAGGHSIDTAELIYGLAAIGLVHPKRLLRNAGARPGDVLILTKGLGVGIYSAALRQDALPLGAYEEMIASCTLLNRAGPELAALGGVHAMTDVTGFGLLGHALEVARASGVALRIDRAALPTLRHAASLAAAGHVTGASRRNWDSYGTAVTLPTGLPDEERALLTDPQTSGGLLVACAPGIAEEVLSLVRGSGCNLARRIGTAEAGPPGITLA